MRGAARLQQASPVDMFVMFYRAGAKADSDDPDVKNAAVVRLATTLEQVSRYLWKLYLEGRPDDETVEVVVRRYNFDQVQRMTWPELVAGSKNMSAVDDLRSILDKLGMGEALGGEDAVVVCIVMESRHGVVHGAADTDIDVADAFRIVEALIHRIFSKHPEVLIQMYLAKARVAKAAPGRPWWPLECCEAIVDVCGKVKGGNQVFVQRSMGWALHTLNRHAEALEAYDRAAGIDPNDAAAHAGRGDALAALGRDADALEAYDRAAGIDPNDAAAHAGRGATLYALGRDADALEAYDLAVGLQPKYAPFHAGRGDALAALGRDADALEAYDRAAGIDPNDAAAHAGRGDALAALGRHAEAQAARDAASHASRNAGRG